MKKKPKEKGVCESCKAVFEKKREWQKFCSSVCRWNDWSERHPRQKDSTK